MSKFLFGRFYDDNEANKIMYDLLKKKTPFEINKNTFLTEIYTNEGTIEKSYSYFKNSILPMEIIKNKDLMYFNITELIDLIQGLPTAHRSRKDRIYYLADAYLDWAVNKGYISMNNLKGLPKDDLCKVNKKIASYKYTNKNTVDEECEKALETNEISVIDIMPLILSRYGILGEGMSKILNLRWDDIDDENKLVRIYYQDEVNYYEIDEMFLKWIDRAKECSSFANHEYIDEGYVIKRWAKAEKRDKTYLHNRITKAFNKTTLPRMTAKSLEFSMKVDLLLRIREERTLTSRDFRAVVEMFEPRISPSSTNTFIKDYEGMTGDKVQPFRIKSEDEWKYVDHNPKESVEKIKKTIGY